MTETQAQRNDLHGEIDQLAVRVERQIKVNQQRLDELPEFEDRGQGNTVQLRKVLNGDMDGLVTNDQ